MLRLLGIGLILVAGVSAASGALSSNLFNGDFENTAKLKSNYTYDNSGNPVGAHRWNGDGPDFGKWIGFWGPPDLEQNGYYGQGGFSTHDYPRGVGVTMQGASGDVSDDRACNNRSLDPYNPGSGNHIMETVSFYPTMASWVKAPLNQTTGQMQLKFDFFYNNWDPSVTNDRFQIDIYGSNFQAPHNVGITWSPVDASYTEGVGSMANPTGSSDSVNIVSGGVTYRSKRLAQFGWGGTWTDGAGDPGTGGWKHMDSTNSAVGWNQLDSDGQASMILPVNLTETFDYYSVTIRTLVYAESHEFFYQVYGYGVVGYDAAHPGPAIGFDNIDFRVSVVPEPATAGLLATCGLLLLRRR